MKIATFDKASSQLSYCKQALCLYPYTLLADEVLIRSYWSFSLKNYLDRDKYNDKYAMSLLLHSFKDDADFMKTLNTVIQHQKIVNKYLQQKRNDKSALKFISTHRTDMKGLRWVIEQNLEVSLKKYKLFELLPFDNNVWKLRTPLLDYVPECPIENAYIGVLSKNIPEHEYALALDTEVENLFSFSLYNSAETVDAEFIKIPLWDFPLFDDITFLQMKYTRDDLTQALHAFKTEYNQLFNKLFTIPFTKDNQQEIKKLCDDSITHHIEPVQQSINNSIYISQLINKTQKDQRMKFCLGITSAENLANYYERCEIVEPYVASQIKQQIGRQMDLQASCIFVYCTF